jgi:ATP-dependent Lon protease
MLVKNVEEGKKRPASVSISMASLKGYLGAPKLHETRLPRRDSVGAAVGLAWTEAGGDVLVIEAAVMKGSGKVRFTGNLGDIMQESAQAALGFLRSHAAKYRLGRVHWEKTDIHVHVPEGAIPKDGPSAGVTLALSMLSALTGRTINSRVAMTGEITLRGAVLPIGGVREKVLAARRGGINEVIIPKENEVDVSELAEWAKEGMEFHYVSNVDEVFNLTLASSASASGEDAPSAGRGARAKPGRPRKVKKMARSGAHARGKLPESLGEKPETPEDSDAPGEE